MKSVETAVAMGTRSRGENRGNWIEKGQPGEKRQEAKRNLEKTGGREQAQPGVRRDGMDTKERRQGTEEERWRREQRRGGREIHQRQQGLRPHGREEKRDSQ